MGLPERLFYPLDKAVNKLNDDLGTKLDVEDLLHYAIIGKLQLCVLFDKNLDHFKNMDVTFCFGFIIEEISVNKDFFYKNFYKMNWLSKPMDAGVPFSIIDMNDPKNGIAIFEKKKKNFLIRHGNGGSIDIGFYYSMTFSETNFNLDFFEKNPVIIEAKVERANFLMGIPGRYYNQLYTNKKTNINYLYLPRVIDNATVDSIYYSTKIKNNNLMFNLSNELTISLDDLLISNKELELLKNGGKDLPEEKINTNIGRKENPYNNIILDIVRSTREKHPNCTGESLARKINQLIENQPNTLSFGSIKQLISRNIPTPKDRNTKLQYELVIPKYLSYLKNK